MNFKFPTMVSTSLSSLIQNASTDGVQLMSDLMAWDPQKRPNAVQVNLAQRLIVILYYTNTILRNLLTLKFVIDHFGIMFLTPSHTHSHTHTHTHTIRLFDPNTSKLVKTSTLLLRLQQKPDHHSQSHRDRMPIRMYSRNRVSAM